MAIRLRTDPATGLRIALCAVESDPAPGDAYLDDADHYALAAKFRRDWWDGPHDVAYPEEWLAMDAHKLRDACNELNRWLKDQAVTDQQSTETLLPCPFCGSEAEIEQRGDRRRSTVYACTNCGCRLETGEEWGHGRAWNTRVTIKEPAHD